ncbi:hypothetical protein BCAR13_750048 [Paraburkholderia caribensis]|nr:hypothetical protein BCAR13_750048 [Paraburkholderia caribensis]
MPIDAATTVRHVSGRVCAVLAASVELIVDLQVRAIVVVVVIGVGRPVLSFCRFDARTTDPAWLFNMYRKN